MPELKELRELRKWVQTFSGIQAQQAIDRSAISARNLANELRGLNAELRELKTTTGISNDFLSKIARISEESSR